MDFERERRLEEEQKSKIDQAKTGLYKVDAPDVKKVRILRHSSPNEEEVEVPNINSGSWADDSNPTAEAKKKRLHQKIDRILRKVLIFSIVFFVIALAISVFIYIYGNNVISTKNISIDVNAPSSIPSSDPFSFDISIQNNNKEDLILSDVIIDYPDGARNVDDTLKPLISDKIDLGTVRTGELVKKTLNARLFGQENDTKIIKTRFEYKLKGSNAVFTAEKDFSVQLRLAPVSVTVDALKEVNSSQQVVLTANITSNSNNPLTGLALNVTYPQGFVFQQANVEGSDGATGNFIIGDLSPNDSKKITITGTINGQNNEDKIFKFLIGVAAVTNPEQVNTALVSYSQDMHIKNDFISSSFSLDTNGRVLEAGNTITAFVNWENTLDVPVTDAEFNLKLNGDMLDQSKVLAVDGFYDSNQKTITWNKLTNVDLGNILPHQKGVLKFQMVFNSYDYAASKNLLNPHIDLSLNIKGLRLNDQKVTEQINSSFSQSIPIATHVDLHGSVAYGVGPFKNSGPIPPKSGQKTTYTLTYTLSNAINNIKDGEVLIQLPIYITYEGQYSPTKEKITYDDHNKVIRWAVGDLASKTGYGSPLRSLVVKIGFIPSQTQINNSITLVGPINFTGKDTYTGDTIKASSQLITTKLDEYSAQIDSGVVQP